MKSCKYVVFMADCLLTYNILGAAATLQHALVLYQFYFISWPILSCGCSYCLCIHQLTDIKIIFSCWTCNFWTLTWKPLFRHAFSLRVDLLSHRAAVCCSLRAHQVIFLLPAIHEVPLHMSINMVASFCGYWCSPGCVQIVKSPVSYGVGHFSCVY